MAGQFLSFRYAVLDSFARYLAAAAADTFLLARIFSNYRITVGIIIISTKKLIASQSQHTLAFTRPWQVHVRLVRKCSRILVLFRYIYRYYIPTRLYLLAYLPSIDIYLRTRI